MLGQHEVRIDERGRLRLPASLVQRHADDGSGQFVLRKGLDHCLTLYPMSAWNAESRRVNQLDDMVSRERRFKRMFFLSAEHVKVDANGRIQMPKQLAAQASIDRDVVLIGVGRHYEIWDAAEHAAEMADAGDMDAMAEEIFGKRSQRA